MGVDTRITFDSTDDDINDLAYDLAERIDPKFFWHHPCIEWNEADYEPEPAHYEVSTMWRYWGPSYQRGYWPTIRAVLAFLVERVHGLRYGGDCDDLANHPLVTPGLLAEFDQVFNTAPGSEYARFFDRKQGLPNDDDPNRPLDAYGKPMIRNGWGPGYELYFSKATGERAEFRYSVRQEATT